MTAPAKVPHSTTPAETTWEGLLSTALVGTARRPPPPSLALDFAVGPDASEDAAALLLTEAAVLSAYRRAGRLPGEAPRNLPAPAVPEAIKALAARRVRAAVILSSGFGEVDDDVRRLLERMTDVMMTSHGVGLAAPQIGVLRRVLVYRVSEEQGVRALVDPQVLERSEETAVDTEGCLSLLGGELSIPVERHTRVRIAGLDGAGDAVEFDAEGFEARVIQHEIDHLDGVLMIDRTTPEARREALGLLRPRIVLS